MNKWTLKLAAAEIKQIGKRRTIKPFFVLSATSHPRRHRRISQSLLDCLKSAAVSAFVRALSLSSSSASCEC